MNRRLWLAVCFAVIAGTAQSQAAATGATPAVAQRTVGVPSNDDLVTRMIQEGTQRSHVDADLQYLLDVIGPRLTGSAEMRRANEWTQQKFSRVRSRSRRSRAVSFGIGWTRGPMTLRMLAPQHREILGVSWAWSPGTKGPVAGDVVFMDARTQSDFDRRFAGKLRGAWVMLGPRLSRRECCSASAHARRFGPPRHAGPAVGPHTNEEVRLLQLARPAPRARGRGRRDPRRRKAIRSIHDERLAGLRLADSTNRHRQRQLRATRASRPPRRTARLEVDISNSFTRDTSSSGIPSPKFAAAKSPTKSSCSARISTRGIWRRAAPTTAPAPSPCSRRRAF